MASCDSKQKTTITTEPRARYATVHHMQVRVSLQVIKIDHSWHPAFLALSENGHHFKKGRHPKMGHPHIQVIRSVYSILFKKKGKSKKKHFSIFLTISNYLIIFQPHFSSERWWLSPLSGPWRTSGGGAWAYPMVTILAINMVMTNGNHSTYKNI